MEIKLTNIFAFNIIGACANGGVLNLVTDVISKHPGNTLIFILMTLVLVLMFLATGYVALRATAVEGVPQKPWEMIVSMILWALLAGLAVYFQVGTIVGLLR